MLQRRWSIRAYVGLCMEKGFYTTRVWPLSTLTLLCHFLPSGELRKTGLPPITGFPREHGAAWGSFVCWTWPTLTTCEMNVSYFATDKSRSIKTKETLSNSQKYAVTARGSCLQTNKMHSVAQVNNNSSFCCIFLNAFLTYWQTVKHH